jgi:PKD repeat protein
MKTAISKKNSFRNVGIVIAGLFLFMGTTFAQDVTPPDPPAIIAPAHQAEAGFVTFEWFADDPSGIDGYSYLIDSVPETQVNQSVDGVNPTVIYDLTVGLYYFHVAAIDGANNWSGTSHYEVDVVEILPPEVTSPLKNECEVGPVIFEWTASDNSGIAGYSYLLDGVTDTVVNTVVDGVDPNTTEALSEGLFYFHVAALDNDGHWSATTHFEINGVQVVPPEIISPKKHGFDVGKIIFEWTASDSDGIAGYSYVLDGVVDTVVDGISEGMATIKLYELSEGVYYFHVAALDGAGNWSETTHFEIHVTSSYLLIDDFDDGAPPTAIGGNMWTFDDGLGSSCGFGHINDSGIVLGGTGHSLQLDYEVITIANPDNWGAGFWTALNLMDFSGYRTLSFWVKGAAGGEVFNIGFENGVGEVNRINASNYIIGGVNTSWQEVIIPLYEFGLISDWTEMDSLSITFEKSIASGSGTIYIDEIELWADSTPVDDFDAERPVDQAPYYSGGYNGASIAVGYDSTDPHGGSGSSLRLTYSGVQKDVTGNYCEWMINFGFIDVSNFDALEFDAKGAVGGEYFNVYLDDGDKTGEHVDIRDYLTLRTRGDDILPTSDGWHHVKIPLVDFANKGADLTSVQSLQIIFEWDDMAGIVYIDNMEFTNRLFKEPSTAAVKISGQKLLIYGKPFTARGVGYQPSAIGKRPYHNPLQYPDPYTDPDFHDVFYDYPSDAVKADYNRQMWARDLTLLREMGCNTIRAWARVTSREFLDACYNDGVDPIYVIMGMYVASGDDYTDPAKRMDVIDAYAEYADDFKDHPAVLMWAVGNENNYGYNGGWHAGEEREMRPLYTLINEVARTIYEVEGPSYRPVMFPNGDLYYLGKDFIIYNTQRKEVRASDTSMNYVDLWGCNAYRGLKFADFFVEYKARSTKPMVITEYGIDAWDNVNSREHEDEQARFAVSAWNEFMANSNVCIGATIMAYSDEWWKQGSKSSHDFDGYPTPMHPDGYSNEEWWGVMRTVDNGADPDIMEPRQVYYALQERWSKELLIDDFDDGADPNMLGGLSGGFASAGSYCLSSYYNDNLDNVLGGEGFSMKINWELVGINSYGGFYSLLHSNELLVDDFNDGTDPNNLGGSMGQFTGNGGTCGRIYDNDPANRLGGEGYSKRIQWDVSPANSWAGFYAALSPGGTGYDARSYTTLSFWVKGAVGQEKFKVSLRDVDWHETKLLVDNYLPWGEVATSWQRVSIPFSAFTEVQDWSKLEAFAIVCENGLGTDTGVIHIEDIRFESSFDARSHDALSFWVKGAGGGELFKVSLRDANWRETKIPITDLLPEGVTNQWQKVSIPFASFANISDWGRLDNFAIVFEEAIGSGSGTIYIDDVKVERDEASLFVDNFNDNIPQNALTGDSWTFEDTGTFIISSEDATNPYGSSGKSLKLVYGGVTWQYSCGWITSLYGADVSLKDMLSFWIRGDAGDEKVNVYLNDGYNNVHVDVESYVPITTDWQKVEIPLYEFSSRGVDLTHLLELRFAFQWEDMGGIVYVDNIEFVNYRTLIKPTLDAIPQFVNTSPITLTGTKAAGTGIYINNVLYYAVDGGTTWSCDVDLVYGENIIRLTARDANNNESDSIVTSVTLNPDVELTMPLTGYIHIVNDPSGYDRYDSTINVNVRNYPADYVDHTGYIIEISDSPTFTPLAFAIYTYWHNSNTAAQAKPIDEDVNFDINLSMFVGAEPDDVWAALPSPVYIKVRAARNGYTPSDADGITIVDLADDMLLEDPNSAEISNVGDDPIVQFVIYPRTAAQRTPGKVIETGYRIDILPRDQDFATANWDDMYHIYKYNYRDADNIPDEVDIEILEFEVDFRYVVESGGFTWPQLTAANGIKARVCSIRRGFTPSDFVYTSEVVVENITRLENPSSGIVDVVNFENDRVITVIVENYDPVNLGVSVPAHVKHKKDMHHTGYRIDICKDNVFQWDQTFSYDYSFDYGKDGIVDEIRDSLPENDIKIDIDLEDTRNVLGSSFVTNGGIIYVRLFAIREGFAVNYEDLHISTISFLNITRLQNPGSHATHYNLGNDRTITIEIEPYDPSGIANGDHLKDLNHAGYRIDISRYSTFNEGYTYHHYYIYDPDEDGVPDEIDAYTLENTKINIDLDICRSLWESFGSPPGPPPPAPPLPPGRTIYVRVLAYKPGCAFNYEDQPTFLAVFNDTTLLAQPPFAQAINYRNGSAIDSSIALIIGETVPTEVVHDGYLCKIDVVGGNGKTYSTTYSITGLEEELNGNIPQVIRTLDIKKLFEGEHTGLMENYFDIPVDTIEFITMSVESTKSGYANSAPLTPNYPFGSLKIRNTSISFLPAVTVIGVTNPANTADVRLEVGAYPGTPPPPGPAYYDIQCSSDITFPDDDDGDVTITESVQASGSDITHYIDVGGLLATATGNDIYVRTRFSELGYTPGAYTSPFTVNVPVLPPIADFAALPSNGLVPLNVSFLNQSQGTITDYEWNFGDGSPTETGPSVSHPYGATGRYDVTLVVSGPAGTDSITKIGYIKVGDTVITGGSIQSAVTSASDGDVIIIGDNMYDQDNVIEIDKDVRIIGGSMYNAVMGNIVIKGSNATVEDLNILYNVGEEVTYANAHYPDGFTVVSDAGITAIDSEITVKNCNIMPDPNDFPTTKFGKAIQIWNLYGSSEISPTIENNLILNADVGIYLYAHASGSAILGEINNNTLDLTNYGIVMRRYDEVPLILDNIITNSVSAITMVYNDDKRNPPDKKIAYNVIGNVLFANTHYVWCHESEKEFAPLPSGIWELQENLYKDPMFDSYYVPQNDLCEGKGYLIPSE